MRATTDDAESRSRFQLVLMLVSLHLLLLPATGVSTMFGAGVARDLRLTGSVAGTIAGVALAGMLLFRALMPALRLSIPRILQDVVVAVVSVVAVFGTGAVAHGPGSVRIVATGAVLTGVIGLALQDMLGNVFGGLSLQLDHTIRVGD